MEEEKRIQTLLDRTALSIRATRINVLPDGLNVLVTGEDDVDKILSERCTKLLREINLIAFCQPKKAAKQTVVIHTRSALQKMLNSKRM